MRLRACALRAPGELELAPTEPIGAAWEAPLGCALGTVPDTHRGDAPAPVAPAGCVSGTVPNAHRARRYRLSPMRIVRDGTDCPQYALGGVFGREGLLHKTAEQPHGRVFGLDFDRLCDNAAVFP